MKLKWLGHACFQLTLDNGKVLVTDPYDGTVGYPELRVRADAALSSALLPYMYRKGFCSCCRRDVVEAMLERGLLTPALIAECRHDCNLEIRELVEAL